jgi:hypothetical protein
MTEQVSLKEYLRIVESDGERRKERGLLQSSGSSGQYTTLEGKIIEVKEPEQNELSKVIL